MGRLQNAIKTARVEAIDAALANGESPDGLEGEEGPLHLAAQEGLTKVVLRLLAIGAEVNLFRKGDAALHRAASQGNLPAVEILIEAGAEVDPRDRRDETPALHAARFGHLSVTELLIAKGADPTICDRRGRSVREWLALGGIPGQFRVLSATSRGPAAVTQARHTELIRKMMQEADSVEEYAAHHGRDTLMYSLDGEDLPDPEVDRWAKRFGEIIRSPERLAECEDRFLAGDALARAKRRQARAARWHAKQAELTRRRSAL